MGNLKLCLSCFRPINTFYWNPRGLLVLGLEITTKELVFVSSIIVMFMILIKCNEKLKKLQERNDKLEKNLKHKTGELSS